MRNVAIIALIFIIPILGYMILTKGNADSADKQFEAGKPQIVKFTSAMCLDCKKLKKELDDVYPNYSDQIVLIEVGVQDENEFTRKQIEKYNVTLVPTLVFIDKDGKVVQRTEGFLTQNEIEKYMKELIND